eukprot:scaffold263529_cov31-Tisochrysis_lutea.AAC.3
MTLTLPGSLHLRYTVFGEVLEGENVLSALEKVETRKEGIFVMPKHRITITQAVVQHGMKEEF